jgi:hypothetical protein
MFSPPSEPYKTIAVIPFLGKNRIIVKNVSSDPMQTLNIDFYGPARKAMNDKWLENVLSGDTVGIECVSDSVEEIIIFGKDTARINMVPMVFNRDGDSFALDRRLYNACCRQLVKK